MTEYFASAKSEVLEGGAALNIDNFKGYNTNYDER